MLTNEIDSLNELFIKYGFNECFTALHNMEFERKIKYLKDKQTSKNTEEIVTNKTSWPFDTLNVVKKGDMNLSELTELFKELFEEEQNDGKPKQCTVCDKKRCAYDCENLVPYQLFLTKKRLHNTVNYVKPTKYNDNHSVNIF